MENKGWVIGMTFAVAVSSVVGGIGGHFMTKNKTAQDSGNSQVSTEKDFVEYELPDGFSGADLSIETFGDDYAIIGSSSLGVSYFLDKKTGDMTYLAGETVSSVSNVINNKCLLHFSSLGLRLFDISTKNITAIPDLVVPDSSFSFVGSKENEIYGFSSNKFYAVDIEKLVAFTADLSVSCYNNAETTSFALNLEKVYILSLVSSSTSSSKTFVIDKETKESKYLGDYGFSEELYSIKDKKVYFVSMSQSNSGIHCLNLETNECSLVQEGFFDSYLDWKIQSFNEGIVVFQTTSGPSAYFLKFEDNSVTTIENFVLYKYGVDLLGSYNISSGSGSAQISKFNAKTGEWEVLFESPNISYGYRQFCFFEYNGKTYAELNSELNMPYLVEVSQVDGEIKFKELSFKGKFLNCINQVVEVGDNEIISLNNSSTYYYNFETDVFRHLNCGSIIDYSVAGDIISLYGSSGIKYEFNRKTMTLLKTAYCEEV